MNITYLRLESGTHLEGLMVVDLDSGFARIRATEDVLVKALGCMPEFLTKTTKSGYDDVIWFTQGGMFIVGEHAILIMA